MVKKRKKKKVFGTKERPRLCVFRSLKHIHAQVINDVEGKTVAAVSSLKLKQGGNVAAAQQVGTSIAEKLKAAGFDKVVFDRGSAIYHGRVKALAEAVRQGGIQF